MKVKEYMKIPKILEKISRILQKHHAKTILVGGSVRDHFLQIPTKDYDIEVYGLNSMDTLEKILCQYGTVNLVGKSFGVLKFYYKGEAYDFSFPRKEKKIGAGHRGFKIEVDGSLCFEDASRRRDFTINALGYDIAKKEFFDPFEAYLDMERKILRHIDEHTFIEDPLRVYRAIQFCARFGYNLAKETKVLCQKMVEERMLETLPKERVYVEFKKLLLRSEKPSLGFELMRELGILRYFPELEALIDVKQDPKWHPEGDVWIHTMMTVDAMALEITDNEKEIGSMDEKQKLKFLFAILCHDLGKATTTIVDQHGRIRAIGHENAGVELTKALMYKLTNEHDFIESLLPLVEHHLKPAQFYAAKSSDKAVRKLASKVNIEELVVVAKADFLGRSTEEALTGDYKAGRWLLEKASKLSVNNKPLENLLQGRDLMALGLNPSPKFKEILDEIYTLQLDGKINTKDDALDHVAKKFRK